jgi:Carboxypeptidase regulatory-like domain
MISFIRYFYLVWLVFMALFVHAQSTSARLIGVITDQSGLAVPGVMVQLNQTSTGYQNSCTSDAAGRFVFADLRPGSGYLLATSSIGFQPFSKQDIRLPLGQTTEERIVLTELVSTLTEVIITQSKRPKKGADTQIQRSTLDKLPSLSNSLQDFTRLTPYGRNHSFAGTNFRYNNLAIDGAASNDAFGFVEPSAGASGAQASGTPGSLARTQPISLEAVQEIQVAVAPYDVTMGNFTGGSMNVVTKSGTNETHCSAYSFLKNTTFTGRSADQNRSKIDAFSDLLSGVSLGGALIKNKLFYFTNLEYNNRTEPVQFAAGSAQSAFPLDQITALSDTLKTRYGYDAGVFGAAKIDTKNFKYFVRLDLQQGQNNHISLRYNRVQAEAENLSRSANIFNFGSQGFTHFSNTNSVVLEWKTRFNDRFYNKFIGSFSDIDEHRTPFGAVFPHTEISLGAAGNIFLGQYREASIFRTKQRTLEFTDQLQYYTGAHSFTIGTHNEYYQIGYHFITPWTGRWSYSSLANFYANRPSRIRRTYDLNDNSYSNLYDNPVAKYGVLLSSFYAQDEIALLKNRLSLQLGLRSDFSFFPQKPSAHPDVTSTPGLEKYTTQLSNKIALAPRMGFKWQLDEAGSTLIRGGSGVFTGRMPFAWLTYAYLYDGNHYGNIDYRPANGKEVPITASVGDLQALQGNTQREINLLDPNLRLPQVWRSNLSIEKNWTNGWQISAEALFTKTMWDVKFETLNLKADGQPLSGADNRLRYSGSKINPSFTSVFVTTNTRQGHRVQYSFGAEKTHKNWIISGHYTYGVSKDIANGVRVSPQANWEWNQTIDPNNPSLSYSNFDSRNNIAGTFIWNHDWTKKLPFSVSLAYLANSGVPFTYVYTGDINRDGSPTNDLLFVPADQATSGLVDIKNTQGVVTLSANDQWAQLDQYISADKYLSSRRGKYVERNGARSPWNQQLDLRLLQQFILKNNRRVQLTLDFINLGNLLSYRFGRQYFVSNTTNSGYALLTLVKVENNQAQYRFDAPTQQAWQYDPTLSRLQGQLGIKFIF